LESAGTDVKPGSIYKSREGEAEIQALYDEALAVSVCDTRA